MLGRELRRSGAAPCLLAFHGFGGSPNELQPMLDRVHDAGFAVRAPLLPGHGTSVAELQDRTFAEWLGAARTELADARAAHGSVVVLGFSMGSLVAMELALDPGAAGGVVGLVVLGNALRLSGPLRAAFGALERFGLRAPRVLVPKPRPADMVDREAAKQLGNYASHPLRAAQEVFRAGRKTLARIGELTVPTLVVHGAKDHVCPVENAYELARRIPHATLSLHANSAHVVAADLDRDAVARDVVAFVRARADELPQRRPVEP